MRRAEVKIKTCYRLAGLKAAQRLVYRLSFLFESLLQISKIPYLCFMQTKKMTWRSLSAGLLLILFAFILVEKNNHGHNSLSKISEQHSLAIIHSGFDCLICEFQLAANADMPVVSEVSLIFPTNPSANFLFHQPTLLGILSLPAERGPPAQFC